MDLDSVIGKVQDFPKKGILFYDITTVFKDSDAFRYCVEQIKEYCLENGIEAIAGVEARGFLFSSPVALELDLPLILVRKKGKLPTEVVSKTFELEYGEDVIEIQKKDIVKGQKILLVDDLIATGGTLKAAGDLLNENGAVVKDIFCVIGLPFLNYNKTLSNYNVNTLIEYDSE